MGLKRETPRIKVLVCEMAAAMNEHGAVEAVRRFALTLEQAGHSRAEIAKALVCFGLALGEQEHGPEAWLEILASASQRLATETTEGTG